MLVFAHIQKTAGKTVTALLRNHFGTRHCDLNHSPWSVSEPDLRWVRRLYPDLRSLAGHACMPFTVVGELPGARHFTFLRDAKSRALSAYQYGVHRGRPMPPFCEWIVRQGNAQTRALAGSHDVERAIAYLDETMGFVGLLDSFNESLVLWKRWLDIPDFDCRYVSRNTAPSNEVKRAILADPRCVEALEEHTRLDQQLVAHARDAIYALQRERFGPGLDAEVEAFESSLAGASGASLRGAVGRLKRNLVVRPLCDTARALRPKPQQTITPGASPASASRRPRRLTRDGRTA